MAMDVTIRSITSLPGGGKTIGGVASNGKVIVVGDINITTLAAAGELINAPDLGLTTIDGFFVSPVDVDDVLPTTGQQVNWDYNRALSLLLLSDGTVWADPDASGQVRFVAFGEAASAPELV